MLAARSNSHTLPPQHNPCRAKHAAQYHKERANGYHNFIVLTIGIRDSWTCCLPRCLTRAKIARACALSRFEFRPENYQQD